MSMDYEFLRNSVGETLGIDPRQLSDEENLLSCGLDSMRVMSLANHWRRRGVRLRAATLLKAPTLESWWQLIRHAQEPQSLPSTEDFSDAEASADVPDHSDPFDMTPVQYAYWVGRQRSQILGGVACHFYVEFDGQDVDANRLERAVFALTQRHESLRTQFQDNGQQRVLSATEWPGLTIIDLAEAAEPTVAQELLAIRERHSHMVLPVESGRVFEVTLTRLKGGASRIHFNIDLLVADAQSMALLFNDLAMLYEDPERSDLPLIKATLRSVLEPSPRDDDWEVARRYWQRRIADLPGGPQLPLRQQPGLVGVPRFTRRDHIVPQAEYRKLCDAAKEHDITTATLMAAAFAEILAAFSKDAHFLLNVPLCDRDARRTSDPHIVADFTNILLVEVDLNHRGPFVESASKIQEQMYSDLAHSRYSGVEVLRDLSRMSPGEPVAVPVVFTSALGMGDLYPDPVRRTLGTPGWMISQAPQVWLDHQVTERDQGVLINWDYVSALFPPGLVDAMFKAYLNLLYRLAEDPHAWFEPVGSQLSEVEITVREQVNSTRPHRDGGLLQDGFWKHALIQPQHPAVICRESTWTYGELLGQVRGLMQALTNVGVGVGDLVAITIARGAHQVAAALAVVTLGAAYVPIGVAQPEMRRSKIVEQAKCAAIVIDSEHASAACGISIPVVVADRVPPLAQAPQPVRGDDEDLAYVIYTSGSTGDPKGVMISHKSALNTIEDLLERHAIGSRDRVLAVSALDFDLSVFDIFGLLTAGGTVVCIDEDEWREPAAWLRSIGDNDVTIWNSVPALLDMLLIMSPNELPASLRLVMLSGDWIGLDLPGRLRAAAPGAALVAMGGATEAAIWSNAWDVDEVLPEWKSIPYGYPLRNQRFRVVDKRGRDCPQWVPGELWIGGMGVALGYLGSPGLTAERFVDVEGERWYRTGDTGRYVPGGVLEFLGRVDHQVKVHGYRVELGEVETALSTHPQVMNAYAAMAGAGRLVAAVTTVSEEAVSTEGILEWTSLRLPTYMVPAQVEIVRQPPLSVNGKIDRNVLLHQLINGEATIRPDAAPVGPIECDVAEVWSSLLDVNVAREDSFFVLGGDSLQATRVISRLRERGYPGTRLSTLFAHPVLKDYAATLVPHHVDKEVVAVNADPAHAFDPFPCTPVQQAYWLGRSPSFTLGGVGSHWYREFDGPRIDVERLRAAFRTLIDKHPSLRTVIVEGTEARVLPEVPPFEIAEVDASDDMVDHELDWMRAALSSQIFAPDQWPIMEVRVVHYGGRSRIGLSFDYIVLDAMSILLLLQELSELVNDPLDERPTLGFTFRDYVLATTCEPREESFSYWKQRLQSLPPAPALPLARNPETIVQPVFTRRQGRIEPSIWDQVKVRAQRRGLTLSSVLATAFAHVLQRWSNQPALTMNLTMFDRREIHPDVGRVLGDFTNLVLASSSLKLDHWSDDVATFQAQIARDLEHSDVSAIWVLRELARIRESVDVAMPVVLTSTLGITDDLTSTKYSFGEEKWSLTQTPQVWIDHQISEVEGELVYNWDCVEELFPEGVLDGLLSAYTKVIRWLGDEKHDWETPIPELVPPCQLEARARLSAGPLHTLACGQIVGNRLLQVLDYNLRPCPDWVIGDVYQIQDGRSVPVGFVGRHLPGGEVELLDTPDAESHTNGGEDSRGISERCPEIEQELTPLWMDALSLEQIAVTDNFIALGGDSILGTRLVATIQSRLGLAVSVRELFENPTIADLARVIGGRVPDGTEVGFL